MKSILITYGTQAFAQRIGRSLANDYQVAYATSEPLPDILLKQGYHRIPTGANPTFAHELLKLCLDQDCTYLLPLGKLEVAPLAEARVLLEEYGITLLLPEDISSFLVLEQPQGDVRIIQAGKDLLTGELRSSVRFSGAALIADGGEEPAWCLI